MAYVISLLTRQKKDFLTQCSINAATVKVDGGRVQPNKKKLWNAHSYYIVFNFDKPLCLRFVWNYDLIFFLLKLLKVNDKTEWYPCISERNSYLITDRNSHKTTELRKLKFRMFLNNISRNSGKTGTSILYLKVHTKLRATTSI